MSDRLIPFLLLLSGISAICLAIMLIAFGYWLAGVV